MTDDFKIKAPGVAAAFEHASKGSQQEKKKEKLTLELRPPVPTPMGLEAPQAQVSPQLESEERKRELTASILVKRDFNRAASDAVER